MVILLLFTNLIKLVDLQINLESATEYVLWTLTLCVAATERLIPTNVFAPLPPAKIQVPTLSVIGRDLVLVKVFHFNKTD